MVFFLEGPRQVLSLSFRGVLEGPEVFEFNV